MDTPRKSLTLIALALVGLALPAAAGAQEAVAVQQPAAAAVAPLVIPTVSEEKLTAYAAAYSEIGDVRERINAEFARTGNKIREAQEELRKQRQEEVQKIIEAKGLTPDEYEQITWVLSVDAAQMEAFAEVLARQNAMGGGPAQQ